MVVLSRKAREEITPSQKRRGLTRPAADAKPRESVGERHPLKPEAAEEPMILDDMAVIAEGWSGAM
ncbi:hypothetical protein [Zavarzinella formosa]|uniref:hypothetical protein n=1 Tax=Zavarzinella formosa TaxID=360055 RepID=UPI0002EFE17E|nr:hypothetical protein [Zavarzinella formosa]